MLALPCLCLALAFLLGASSLVVRISAAVWALAFLHALFSRLRYLNVATRWLGFRFPRRVLALLPVFVLVDFLAWTIPLSEYPSRCLRQRW